MSTLLRSVASKFHQVCFSQGMRHRCTTATPPTLVEKAASLAPLISCKLDPKKISYEKPRQVWIENLDTVEERKLGLAYLDPEIYAVKPRIDVIQQNVTWQRRYRFVSYAHTKVASEVQASGRKPWPQKGMGRARHGTRRSPLWRKGGIIHGPRSPTPHFYMLPFFQRVAGLTSTLSVKLAQDDLHIVKDLDIPSRERDYILALIEERNWGPSVLFVDASDIMPENITLATDTIKHVNLMPVYGLNVYSMLKHETLVLTEPAANLIQEKLLYQLHRPDSKRLQRKFQINQQ